MVSNDDDAMGGALELVRREVASMRRSIDRIEGAIGGEISSPRGEELLRSVSKTRQRNFKIDRDPELKAWLLEKGGTISKAARVRFFTDNYNYVKHTTETHRPIGETCTDTRNCRYGCVKSLTTGGC